MNRDRSSLARIGFALAVVSALAVALSPIGYRLGWWGVPTALLQILKWGVIGAIVALLVCLVALVRARGAQAIGLALAGLVLSAAFGGYPAYLKFMKVDRLPYIHDITTDTDNPPAFIALAQARKAAPNGLDYKGAEIAGQQKQAYPDIAPMSASLPPQELFKKAEALVRASGWEIAEADPVQGRIEATYTSRLYAFKDDIAIRITAAPGGGSRLDMRSMSRVGRSDVGANAARIRAFMRRLQG